MRRRRSGTGSSESGMNQPSVTPQAKGTAMPAKEITMAALPTFLTSLRSTSIPVSSSSKRMPNWEMASIIAFCSFANGKIQCCRSGHNEPKTDGPSRMPASNCPMTDDWPTRLIASPSRRPTRMRRRSSARKTPSGGVFAGSPACAPLTVSTRKAAHQKQTRQHERHGKAVRPGIDLRIACQTSPCVHMTHP